MLTVLAALVTASILAPEVSAEETWVRYVSHDKKASALFPAQPDKIETLTRKSPAGTINTRRGQYEREGALLSLAGTKLPRAALRFAGTDKILRDAADGVLGKYFAKKTSEKKTTIGGEPAVILEFHVPDYDKEDHPGYRGDSGARVATTSWPQFNRIAYTICGTDGCCRHLPRRWVSRNMIWWTKYRDLDC
jgi:hypothetical protein